MFLRLGSTSFGGPIAHLGYLRAEFVERRKWLDDERFADLVALCQFLPGPASSQVVFALGVQRAGLLGGSVASLCFTLPSALLMLGFALGMTELGDVGRLGAFGGLRLGAVAVVAVAVHDMAKKLWPDRERATLGLLSAALLLVNGGSVMQLAVIGFAALAGMWLYRARGPRPLGAPAADGSPGAPRGHGLALLALVAFGLLLALLPALALVTDSKTLGLFDAFYRTGSLVFGGGHVMLPLLRAEVVPPGLLTDDEFLAGYGAAQALPGPLMAFAAFVGAAIDQSSGRIFTGLFALFAILLPGLLLVGGALPFWERLRAMRSVQAAFAGVSASVVGVLLAALITPLVTESVRQPADVAVVVVSFALLALWRAPAWAAVLLCAAYGHFLPG